MGDQGLGSRSGSNSRGRAAVNRAPAPPGPNVLQIEIRQRRQRISRNAIRQLLEAVLSRLHCTGEIGLHFVGPREMARLNWEYLKHPGSTDVITFDYGSTQGHLHGEGFICVADAMAQSVDWQTTWQEEVGRYVIHALLHLAGHDDLEPAARRLMKRRENSLTQALIVRAGWRPDLK